MRKPLPNSVITKVTSINVDDSLSDWMTELLKVNGAYQTFFAKDSDEARKLSGKFCEDHGINLEMPFPETFLTNLYYKFHQMQSLLKENSKTLPIELLLRLEPYVGKKYQQALNTCKTVKDRFKQVTDPIYTKTDTQGTRISVADSRKVMEIMKVAPKAVLGDPSAWQGGPVYALGYLTVLKKQAKIILYISVLAGKADLSDAYDCSKMTEAQERKYLNDCMDKIIPQEDWAIHHSRFLNINRLEKLFAGEKGERLRFLDLRGAQRGDLRALDVLSQMCPNLEYLNLSNWPNLETIAKVDSFPLIGKPVLSQNILFFHLKRLLANSCAKLTNIQVNLPRLQILEIKDTQEISLDLNLPLLEILDVTGYQQEPRLSSLKVQDLKKLVLVGHTINDAVLSMSGKSEVDLSARNLTILVIWLLAQRAAPNLTFLNLTKDFIGDKGIKALSTNISWTKLKSLYLSYNFIGNEGAQALSTNTSWTKLQFLDLSYNSIGNEGMKALSATTSWTNLQSLNLSDNIIGAEGIQALSTNTSWTNLQSLDLRGCLIGDEGKKALASNPHWKKLTESSIRI